MTATPRPRTKVLVVIGVATLLAMVSAALVVWIRRDGAEQGALQATIAAAPVTQLSPVALGEVAPPVPAERPVQPLAEAPRPATIVAEDGSLTHASGPFAGLPRAWTVPLTLRGRVVDERGAPLAGARITSLADTATRDLLRSNGTRRLSEDELDALLPSVLTASDGSFVLGTARGLGELGLADRNADSCDEPAFVVDDPRCAVFVAGCGRFASGDIDARTVTVTTGAFVTGRVVDAGRRPVAGIRVRLSDQPADGSAPAGTRCLQLPAGLRVAITAADGSYSFRSLWPGSATILLESPGWRAARCDLPAFEAGARVQAPELIAERGGAVSGVVLSAPGVPLAGARVHALGGNWNTRSDAAIPGLWTYLSAGAGASAVRTADDGRFTIEGLQNEPQAVLAGAEGFAPAIARGVWPDTAEVQLTLAPDAAFARDGALAVLVTDRAGTPRRDAFVQATTMRPGALVATQLPVAGNESGVFTVSAVGASPVELVVMAAGCATTCLVLSPPASDAAPAPQRLVLPPESIVEGSVLDETGHPVPGLAVILMPEIPTDSDGRRTHAMTDGEGRFSVGALAAGAWFASAMSSGTVQSPGVPIEVAEGGRRDGVVLKVSRCGALEGRRHYRDGSVAMVPKMWFLDDVVYVNSAQRGDAEQRGTAMASDGTFRMEGMPAGEYELSVPLAGVVHATVRSGETTVLDLVVPTPPLVHGRVLAGTAPVPGVGVTSADLAQRSFEASGRMISDLPEPVTVQTDADGCFTLPLLHAGDFAVWAEAQGGGRSPEAKLTLGLDEEASGVELQLSSGRIEGDVVDAVSGLPIAKAMVFTGEGWVTTDDSGRFVMAFLPPGPQALRVQAAGHVPQALQPVTLAADQTVSGVHVALGRAARIDVTVVGPNGQPLSGGVGGDVCVMALPVDPARVHVAWGTQVQVKDGHALLEDLEPASYWVGIRDPALTERTAKTKPPEEFVLQRVQVSVAAGETREVVVRSEPGP